MKSNRQGSVSLMTKHKHQQPRKIWTTKEVDAAKKSLLDAEKRWEVIDIDEEDSDDSLNNDDSRKKKRKVSVVSPRGSNSNNNSAGNYSAPDLLNRLAIETVQVMTPGQGIIALRLLVDQIASIEIELQ